MKIHEITGVEGNFGDTLNGWLWTDLHPQLFDQADDGVNFIGIGSILDRRLPVRGLNVVFGTGTGYAPPPDVQADPQRWRFYGVRGPLTARLLGLPREAALTDPAILLAEHPRWRARPDERRGVVFVPHWKSVRYGQWAGACALAGIEFIDPCLEAHTVIDRIASARLVIAESMHAAIVADTLRVPWVPVMLSREVSPFKWADWAATVGLEYTPLLLSPSSPIESLRARVLAHSSFSCVSRYTYQSCDGEGPRELAWTREQLLGDHATTIARMEQVWRWRYSVAAEALLKRLAAAAPATHERLQPDRYARQREAAAEQLRRVQAAPSHLSADADHGRALSRCYEAVARLQADRAAGRLVPGQGGLALAPAHDGAATPAPVAHPLPARKITETT